MGPVKVPAHDWTFEIESAAGGTWIEIGGINSMGGIERVKNDADATDFQSGAWEEHQTMRRGKSLACEGFFLVATEIDAGPPAIAVGDRDLGQARVEEMVEIVGPTSFTGFRLTDPAGQEETWTEASFDVSGVGGGNDDLTSWGFAVRMNGAPVVV